MCKRVHPDPLRALAEDLLAMEETDALLVVTGAGVSLASGIPTFRGSDPDAVWAKDTTTRGTYRFFAIDPVSSWLWYLSRFESLAGAKPNPAHHALVDLERWQIERGGDVLLVTQNIDGLHRAAGSERLVEVHGRADRVRCDRIGCENAAPRGSLSRAEVDIASFLAAPSRATVPRCPSCGALLRPHVLWFDETYTEHVDYGFGRAMYAASRASVIVFAGTSFAVGITALVLEQADARGVPVYSIDPVPRSSEGIVRPIVARAEEALVALVPMLASAKTEGPFRV